VPGILRSAIAALVGIWVTAASGAAGAERPNVLFIAIDDLRPELGTYGAPALTPNIDRLAAQGMRFDRAYTEVAACAASRASMLSGAYAHTTRVYFMGPPLSEANPNLTVMPKVFKDAGYETVEVGKFLHVREDAPNAWSREPWMPPDWQFPHYHAPENLDKRGDRSVPRGPIAEATDLPDSEYLDGQVATRAIEELRRLRDRPFFLAVGFLRPHLPFICPKKYWELYDPERIEVPNNQGARPALPEGFPYGYELGFYTGGETDGRDARRRMVHGYRACVSFIDAQVGRVLDELARLKLADRTLVVLWGDHGWHLGENGIWGKTSVFERALRVPLILRVPGVRGGRSTSALVETVDLLPTLCELSGLEIPGQVQGRSLAPLLEDPDLPWKQAVFGSLRIGHFPSAHAVRTPRFRFVRWVSHDAGTRNLRGAELYDHASDPGERVNLAREPEHARRVQRLHALLSTWLRGEPVR
jgi:arylsulfatase A-like enzyme